MLSWKSLLIRYNLNTRYNLLHNSILFDHLASYFIQITVIPQRDISIWLIIGQTYTVLK